MHELEDTERHQGYAITSALTRIGEPAIPALLKAVKDRVNEDLREYAVRALGGMGTKAKSAIPTLIEALSDPEDEVKTYAAYALSKMEDAAVDAVPALIQALENESDRVKHHVAFALSKIGTPEALQALKGVT